MFIVLMSKTVYAKLLGYSRLLITFKMLGSFVNLETWFNASKFYLYGSGVSIAFWRSGFHCFAP